MEICLRSITHTSAGGGDLAYIDDDGGGDDDDDDIDDYKDDDNSKFVLYYYLIYIINIIQIVWPKSNITRKTGWNYCGFSVWVYKFMN